MTNHKVVQCDLMDKCKRCSDYPCNLINNIEADKRKDRAAEKRKGKI